MFTYVHQPPILCPFSWIFAQDRLVDVQTGLSHRWRHMGYMWNCLSWLYMYTCKKGYVAREAPRGGGGGRVLWYFNTYVCSGHFWGFNILNLKLLFFFVCFFSCWGGGGGQKMISLGVWRFCGYLLGVDITKLDYIYVSFLCILGYFLKVKVQVGLQNCCSHEAHQDFSRFGQ